MNQIRVVDVVGPVCVAPADGALLCQRAYEAFSQDFEVSLDFTGVRTLTSSFLNAAVGCLFANYPVNAIEAGLRWSGLDPIDQKLVRFVMKNAIRFYSATLDQQEEMAAVPHRAIEG